MLRKMMRPSLRSKAPPRPRSLRPTLERLEDRTVPSAPSVTSLTPNFGPVAGGTHVEVVGSGFTGATLVDFGPVAGSALQVVSDTEILVNSPAEGPQIVDVTVTTPGGMSATSSADQFTYGTATTTSLSSSATTTTYGQSVTFTATVSGGSGTPTGTVWFNDGGNVIGTATLDNTGRGTFTTSALAVGGHSITANYGGDANYVASGSSALTQTVQIASTSVAVTSDSVNLVANPGQAVTLTATVTGASGGAPTGTVTFYDGGTALGTANLAPGGSGSQATLTISTLAGGPHSITASYGGDASYLSSNSSALIQTVQNNGTYVWIGAVSRDWNTLGNWLENGAVPTQLPGATSDVIFGVAAGGTDANCQTDGPVYVHSLSMDPDYTGTLTLIGDLEVQGGGLDVENGNINQPNGAASEIDVNGGAFNWAGGTINSGTTVSNLQLFNVSGRIGGPVPALNSGDNLDINNGTTISLWQSGNTLSFILPGAGINIASGGKFVWDIHNGSITGGAGGAQINNSGTFLVTAGGAGTCSLPYYSNASSALLDLEVGSKLKFTSGGADDSAYSVLQDNGAIYFNGGTLEVDAGLQMNGGNLTTSSANGGAIRGGAIYIHGGSVNPGASTNATGSSLDCTGCDVTMDGGTYNATVDFKNLRYSQWTAKSFTIGSAAQLAVTSQNVPAQLPPPPVGVFVILKTQNTNISGDFTNSQNILITGTNTKWKAGVLDPNNKTEYELST
jgi:hypothetical protein